MSLHNEKAQPILQCVFLDFEFERGRENRSCEKEKKEKEEEVCSRCVVT
jgi:hypothetical protein